MFVSTEATEKLFLISPAQKKNHIYVQIGSLNFEVPQLVQMFAEAEEIFKVHQQMNQKHTTIKKILVFKPDFYVII